MLGISVRPTATVRAAVFVVGDLLIWAASLWGAYLIRFDGDIPSRYLPAIPVLLLALIPIKLAWHTIYRLYKITWRSVGLSDFMSIVKANTLALGTMTIAIMLARWIDIVPPYPRSVLLLDYVLTTCGITVFRAGRRGWQVQREALRARYRKQNGTRLLIIGAGAAGARIAQSMEESGDTPYHPVGFIDDDPSKQGAYIRGLKVFGGRSALARVVREQDVEEVLVAVPSAPLGRLREIVDDIRRSGVQRIKVLPGMHEWLAGRVTLKDIREVQPHDLLGRPPLKIHYDVLGAYLAGKRVMVTGAAGSIGSELVRQVSRFGIDEVVAADVSESGLFELEQGLRRELPDVPLRTALADIRDASKIDWLMRTTRPHLVFHAAAYKHVPMMEREVEEAVKTNILGTLTVGEAALNHGVDTFVLISTDKAVNPVSVMGASKRIGELVAGALGQRGKTRFMAVRFGNVLGSRGSIIPVLQEQIRRGGPVTITHPDMTRYFMSIAEAVLLVLQTPLMTTPGSVFMLDMGEPVRILDLARELIRLSGLEPDKDIPVVFSGIRAGEKMEEELVMPNERLLPTVFEGIKGVSSDGMVDEATLRLMLRELERLVQAVDSAGIRVVLERLVRSAPERQATERRLLTGVPNSG